MSDEWIEWVHGIGYTESPLTLAEYKSLFRGPAKEVFEFLQTHIRIEEEARMIKENAALYDHMENQEKRQYRSRLEAETMKAEMEIEEAEKRIEDLQNSIYSQGDTKAKRSKQCSDTIRHSKLLEKVLEVTEKSVKVLNGSLDSLEPYSDMVAAAAPYPERTTDEITCVGCRKSNGPRLMQQLVDSFGEASKCLDKNQFKVYKSTDIKEIATHHGPDCFEDSCLKLELQGSFVNRLPKWNFEEVILPIFTQDLVELLQDSSMQTERLRIQDSVNAAVDDLVHDVLEKDGNSAGTSESVLRDRIKGELSMAGIDGITKWLDAVQKRAIEIEKTLPNMEAEKDRKIDALKRKDQFIMSTQVEIEQLLDTAPAALEEVEQAQKEYQPVSNECLEALDSLLLTFDVVAKADIFDEKLTKDLIRMNPEDLDQFNSRNFTEEEDVDEENALDKFGDSVPSSPAEILALIAKHKFDGSLASIRRYKHLFEILEAYFQAQMNRNQVIDQSTGVDVVSSAANNCLSKYQARMERVRDGMAKLKRMVGDLLKIQSYLENADAETDCNWDELLSKYGCNVENGTEIGAHNEDGAGEDASDQNGVTDNRTDEQIIRDMMELLK